MPAESSFSSQDIVALLQQALESSSLASTIERHDHILLGNGQEGLVVKFRVLEENINRDLKDLNQTVTAIHSELVSLKKWRQKLLIKMATLTGAVSILSLLGGWLFVHSDILNLIVQTILHRQS